MSAGGKLKVRFTSLDCTAIVTELRESLLGLRVSNIYDINQKTYLFKLAKGEKKEFLLIQNGVRVHTTAQQVEKSQMPSGFTMKFRQFLRSKRVEKVEQIGVERVIMITFGSGEVRTHIILELYSSGNIIMTDQDQQIIQLIRSHTYPDGVQTALNEVYPFDHAANLHFENFIVNEQIIRTLLQSQEEEKKEEIKEEPEPTAKKGQGGKVQLGEEDEEQEEEAEKLKQKDNKKGNKKEENKKDSKKQKEVAPTAPGIKFREIVFKLVPSLHNPVIDHVLKEMKISPNSQVTEANIPEIIAAANNCLELLQKFLTQKQKGFLFYTIQIPPPIKQPGDGDVQVIQNPTVPIEEGTKPVVSQEEIKKDKEEQQQEPQIQYFEFSPMILSCHEGKQFKEFSTYNEAVDVYFETVQNDTDPETEAERIAWRKYENIKQDQDNRIKKLRDYQEECEYKAMLIQKNIKEVEAVCFIISNFIEKEPSWDKINKQINESKKDGNPLANLIMDLNIPAETVTLYLTDPDEDETEELVDVEVNFKDTAYTNIENYYNMKKKNVLKEQKTIQASKQALKQAEKTAIQEIEKTQNQSNVFNTRQSFWFEQFYWFISSENYLVISGRDFHQNETLVKKYMRKGDIYMHADYHGAASTIIKNLNKDELIPQVTLNEAAIATICRSKAWDAKIFAAAWWVHDHQVSKKAESGQFLPAGSFMIRGKKNFIHPSWMEMGATLLYRVDLESLARHKDDRQVKSTDPDYISKTMSNNGQLLEDQDLADLPEFQQQSSSLIDELMISQADSFKEEEDKMITIVGTTAPQIGLQYVKGQTKTTQQKLMQQKGGAPKLYPIPNPNLPLGAQAPIESPVPKEKGETEANEETEEVEEETYENQKNPPQKEDKAGKNKKKDNQKEKDAPQNAPKTQVDPQNPNQQQAINKHKLKKMKKMKEKYGEQDDQERELKLKLLGAKMVQGVDLKNKEFSQSDRAKESSEQESSQSSSNSDGQDNNVVEEKKEQKIPETKLDESSTTTNATENPVGTENSQETETKQQEIKGDGVQNQEDTKVEEADSDEEQEKRLQKLEEQRIAAQKNQVEEPIEVIESELMELNRLVTYTYPEDNYEFLVFMCCPYLTLQNLNCKFKIKLSPGNNKKGKAARSVIQYFGSLKEIIPNEKKLLKAMTEQEVINGIIGNVKLSGAGMLKLKEKEQNAKRQSKKESEKQNAGK